MNDTRPPERETHPLLERLYRNAIGVRGHWRYKFNVPQTDPRWLQATELTMLEDLLTIGYVEAHARRISDPAFASYERAVADPDAAAAEDADLRRDLAPGGNLLAQMVSFEKNRAAIESGHEITSIRLQRGGPPAGE